MKRFFLLLLAHLGQIAGVALFIAVAFWMWLYL